MRPRMLLLSALVITSALAPPARAGGWWTYIGLDGQRLGIGESITLRTEVEYPTDQEAEEARGSDYYVYLVKGVDVQALKWAMSRPQPEHWWNPPAEMTLIGDVSLAYYWDSGRARSTAELTIPDMPTGRYDLMLCDRGCRNPLGNLIPAHVEVVDDPLAAQTSRKLQDATERTSLALARLRHDLRQSDRKFRVAKADAADASERVAALSKRVASIATEPPSTPWPSYLAWFVGGIGIASAVVRGRRRVFLTTETPVEHIPDDARELAGSRSRH